MTSAIVFLDTECTGLSLDDDIWEFAAIRRVDGVETEHHLFIEHDPAKCAQLPASFRRDHYQRFPGADSTGCPGRAHGAVDRGHAAGYVEKLTEDRPHIVGAVPNFDTERLARMLSAFSLKWGAHYHLIDVENLAIGYLAARWRGYADSPNEEAAAKARLVTTLPWDSDELSRAVGVEPPGEGVRHTAMGDVRWAMAIYDRVMGREATDVRH